MTQTITEKEKYTNIWEFEGYRESSPGLHALKMLDKIGFDFLGHMFSLGVKSFLDIGCGSGKVSDFLMRNYPELLDVYGFDIADNCLDPGTLPFEKQNYLIIGDLTQPGAFEGRRWDATFCSDVMEHIATDKVPQVLANIRQATSEIGFLAIALFPDDGDALVGHPLHLTVKEPAWWDEKIADAGLKIKWSKEVPYRMHMHAVSKENDASFSSKVLLAIREGRFVKAVVRRLQLLRRRGWYFVVVE
jgi:SAM-dependent methyltransferase